MTIITHGFNGDVEGSVEEMARQIPGYYRFSGTNIICYEVTVAGSGGFTVVPRKVFGSHPTNDFNAEIVIKLDWGALAGFFSQYDTYEVAAVVVPRLLQTNFLPNSVAMPWLAIPQMILRQPYFRLTVQSGSRLMKGWGKRRLPLQSNRKGRSPKLR